MSYLKRPLFSSVFLILLFAALCSLFPGVRRATIDPLAFAYVERIIQDDKAEYLNPWLGILSLQYPNDLVHYQQLIYETRPDYIIETGTAIGGLTFYLSSLLEVMKPEAKIITVDINHRSWQHTLSTFKDEWNLQERITSITGDSVSDEVIDEIRALIPEGSRVLVILDSLHKKHHVLKELQRYSQFLQKGDYIVTTDTHLDYTRWLGFEAGPLAAVKEFLEGNTDFEVDQSFDRFSISTATRNGVVKKVS